MHFATLPTLRATSHPDAPSLRDDAGDLTNADLLERVTNAAAVLHTHGVGPGDVIALALPNRVQLVIALFAAWRLGAAVTPINPVLGTTEAAYQAADAGAVLVVAENDERDLGVPTVTLEELGAPASAPPSAELSADDLALLIYTSGTTGSPKGVMLTHANLDAMTESFATWLELTESDHSLLVLPLFHANGITLGTLTPLRVGGQVSITGRFSRDRFFADVEKYRPTYFSAVPAVYALLSSLPDDVRPDTSSLRFAVCGAAPMPAESIERFETRFGVTIVEGYGLSETTCASTINPLRGLRKPGTVGLPLPGQQVAVVGEDDRPLGRGEVGEVVIAGPVVMAGYLNRPEETERTIVNGWLHTGDLGRFDEDGYLQIVDRIKDMIIRGGENLYPKEIENALYSHEDVREAAVVGAPDPVLGEIPVAFISLRADAAVTASDLDAHARGILASFKCPAKITIMDELPKNPVGKIDKPNLRQGVHR
ncbi:MAG: class I adenylate-forming enzyme family protein [Microbacterium sp.]|uniref:class I adenylate-forming enzyme family protein n=1 Tax=Microbacterium sp. TaxID=51671 RepID=UPI003F963434